jgi:hypothetical protein
MHESVTARWQRIKGGKAAGNGADTSRNRRGVSKRQRRAPAVVEVAISADGKADSDLHHETARVHPSGCSAGRGSSVDIPITNVSSISDRQAISVENPIRESESSNMIIVAALTHQSPTPGQEKT